MVKQVGAKEVQQTLTPPEKYTLTNFLKLSIIYQIEGDYYYGFWTASIRQRRKPTNGHKF